MARPARPAAEVAAVREAAALTPGGAAQRAKSIAARVIAELQAEVEGLTADPFVAALQKARQCPFVTLATSPEIDTLSEFVERRVARLRGRAGIYLTPSEQAEERSSILAEIESLLAGRYLRHLRS